MDVNGERREFFKRFKGLRQGDPLSPLINFVGDAFTAMLNLVCRRGDLEGLVPHLVEKCLSHLGKSLHTPLNYWVRLLISSTLKLGIEHPKLFQTIRISLR